MVHRKGSRKAHHKRSRRHHKGSRKSHRRSHRQHGGASCSAQPAFNRSLFGQQGGMAPIMAGDDYLIDAASRVQAQTAPLDTAFGDLQHVIPRQAGGRRRRSARRGRKSHRRSAHRKGSRSSHRRRRSHRSGRTARRTKRAQHGGALAGYHDPTMLHASTPTSAGLNPQWQEYYPAKGAQAP